MVNFPLPNKNSILTKRDVNYQEFNFPAPKLEPSCEHMIQQPFSVFQQNQTELSQMNCSGVPAKPSPSFMDADSQFNFPTYQSPDGTRYISHVIAENKGQDRVPTLQRQYSINTVMEVIESHDISDTSTTRFDGTCTTQQPNTFTQTQPIPIQQPPRVPFNCGPLNPSFQRSTLTPQQQTIVPPASDLPDYAHGGSLSNSPAGNIPFSRYNEQCNQVSSPSFNPAAIQHTTTCPATPQYQSNYVSQVSTVTPIQTTEEMSPYQPVFSPADSCNMESPALVSNNGQSFESPQVFTFTANPFTPSQTTSDFNHPIQQQQFNSPLTPPESGDTFTYGTQFQYPPPPYDERLTAGTTSSCNYNTSGDQFQLESGSNQLKLEEVDHTAFTEDMRPFSRTPSTELEKSDLKRIRNNKACRASRERRKRRKAEREKLADDLQNKNRLLKERIRQLEEEVHSANEAVKRRMSQNADFPLQGYDNMQY